MCFETVPGNRVLKHLDLEKRQLTKKKDLLHDMLQQAVSFELYQGR